MKVRHVYRFAGVLCIMCSVLVGETLTYDIGGLKFRNLQLVPALAVWQFISSVQCTTTKEGAEIRALASKQDDHHSNPEQRQPRLIKELTMLNRQSCLSKILCGVEVAKPPTSSSSTMNDYAFIVKGLFDILSFGGGSNKKSASQDLDEDEDEDDAESNEDGDNIESPYRSSSRRKNSKKPYMDSYTKDLEDLVNERDGFFRKRAGNLKELQFVQNCTSANNGTTKDCKRSRKLGLFTRPGFMGYSNPRFDKTAFLDRKQLQLEQAANNQEKLSIAAEVAEKLQSPRQCRLLSWFSQPSYTTTTTITTTSNDPAVSQTQNTNIVNTMCPFTVPELQTMILGNNNDSNSQAEALGGSNQKATVQPQPEMKITPVPVNIQPKPAYQIVHKKTPSIIPYQVQSHDDGNGENGTSTSSPYLIYALNTYQIPTSPSYQIYHQKNTHQMPTLPPSQVQPLQTTLKPLSISAYGETDPDAELVKDPLYSLVPPEYGPPQDDASQQGPSQHQFQNFGFSQDKPPNLEPFSIMGNGRPSIQQTLQYFRTTTEKPLAAEEPKYSKYFYLNSDGPSVQQPPPTVNHILPKNQTKVVKLTPKPAPKKTTPKPKPAEAVSDEEDEEDENDENNSGQENDNTSNVSDSNSNSKPKGPPPPQRQLHPHPQPVTGMRHIRNSGGQNSKMTFRIPNKIRISLPSIRQFAANLQKYASRPSINPVENYSGEPIPKGNKPNKRQTKTNLNQEKQLVFKTNLEFQEKVKDQEAPYYIMTQTPPSNLQKLPQPQPPLSPKSQYDKDNQDNSEEDDEEEGSFPHDQHDADVTHDDDQSKPRPSDSSTESEEDTNKPSGEKESEENGDDADDSQQSKPETKTANQFQKMQNTETPSPSTRKPLLPFSFPMIYRSKSNQKQKSYPQPSNIQRKDQRNPTNLKNSTGIFGNILSDHGLRTLSTITSMFYGSQQDEVHPHDADGKPPPPGPPGPPPPGPTKKGPKRTRRPPPYRKQTPRPRPQHDQGDESDEEDDDEEDDESVEEKKPTTTTPIPPPLHPLRIPPKIVAVPIYLEGKEAWEGDEKPHDEEEFFESKPKKRPTTTKPEKYDYDDDDPSIESRETTNSAEGIDFGPGQKIQTEYTDIVNKVKRPGGHRNPNDDRYVLGLPTTWEDMFEELKRRKQLEKLKKKQNQKNSSGSEEEESEEDDASSGPPPRRKLVRRPHNPSNSRPHPSHPLNSRPHFLLEPID